MCGETDVRHLIKKKVNASFVLVFEEFTLLHGARNEQTLNRFLDNGVFLVGTFGQKVPDSNSG